MRLPWRAWVLWALAAGLGVDAGLQEDESKVRKIPLRSHSLSSPYLHSDMQNRYFDFGGDTIVRADQYIRLTSDRPSQEGWLFSRLPLTATNWRIELTFQIHGEGNLHGDGMALWVTKERAKQGPVFGSMDQFEGLGLFIDTYKNNRPGAIFPYVMAMLGNGSATYDKEHDGQANELAGCSAKGLRTASIPTKIRLTYYQEQSLKVELQYQNVDQWDPCFETGPISLPTVAYLGFSAETGELHDNHDIIALETFNMHVRDTSESARAEARKAAMSKGGQKQQQQQQQQQVYRGGRRQKDRGWWWFFLKVIIFLVVVVGGYVGYTAYRASNRGSRF